MFDIILNLGSFLLGLSIGKAQALNTDIGKQVSYMQELIDQAYEERDATRQLLAEVDQIAETWKRRYYNAINEAEDSE